MTAPIIAAVRRQLGGLTRTSKPAIFIELVFATGVPVAWTMAAFCEEMFFRGYLMNRISDLVGTGRAGWISALLVSSPLFVLAHGYQGLAGAIGTAEVGLLLGVMYLGNKRNLWINIVCHGFIDSVGTWRPGSNRRHRPQPALAGRRRRQRF